MTPMRVILPGGKVGHYLSTASDRALCGWSLGPVLTEADRLTLTCPRCTVRRASLVRRAKERAEIRYALEATRGEREALAASKAARAVVLARRSAWRAKREREAVQRARIDLAESAADCGGAR